ncbi:MAG: sugar ABC transporter permease [Clostridia bacterium]
MKKNNWIGYLFVAPNVIGVVVFMLIPFLFSVVLSVMDWNHLQGLSAMTFVGFQNFARLWTDQWFIASVNNNLLYTLIGVPVAVILGLMAAVMLNDRVFGKKFLRAMYFFPYVTNGVAVAFVWMLLFQPRTGPINMFLMSIGVQNPPQWFASTTWALPALIIINIWATLGYNAIIYLANIQSISAEVYEAAEVDGATGMKKFWHVTFPLLTPTTFFLLMTGIISSFKVFGIVSAITQGGPIRSTTVLGYYIYTTAFRNYDMGYAAAISMILFCMIFVVTFVQWRMQKRWVFY